MQGYSLLGYINAVKQRSGKTLLVEGPTDSWIVSRVKHRIIEEGTFPNNGAVDGAAMLQDSTDPSLHGKGNKVKIQALLNFALNDQRVQSALNNKLGTITDREWDGITVGREFQDPWMPPVQAPPNFQTHGHSMENYFFSIDAIRNWLLQAFAGSVSPDFLSEVEKRFIAIIGLAASWSVSIRGVSGIQKASGMINRDSITWVNGAYEIDLSASAEISKRKISVPPNFLMTVNSNAKSYITNNKKIFPGAWLCHGHLGDEIIWSCVANLAKEMQIASSELHEIERGNQNLKFRCLSDFIAREKLNESAPLRDAVEWLCR